MIEKKLKKMVHRPGVAVNRDYWAIKKWFDDEALTIKAVSDDIGVHPSIVGQTIRGLRNTRRVLLRLVELGCPTDVLSLPSDIKGANKNASH
ncbi:MAG: hypothetical protein LBT47_01215 [Deltaproteobacteria bacterium]|jgi:hypothetical protein|nr:hypothetical protein [Deltaproteobacteria bacterium]